MKTSLNISILGPLVTKYVPRGYHPEWSSETTADRVSRAVEALSGVIDGYEFYYPHALNEDNLDEVRRALGGHDIYCIASSLHLDARYARGGFVSPSADVRAEALRLTLAGIDLAGSVGAHYIIWPGVEGYNYPFQSAYVDSWSWLVEGIGYAADRCASHGIVLLLEHKSSSPAMRIHLCNVGMTLHVIDKLRRQGFQNVKVNMDWQHLAMNGENLAECAAILAVEGVLGHLHANSGMGDVDEKNIVGATRFMETLELAVELRRAGYGDNGERLGLDFYPYTEDPVAAVRQSVAQWRFIEGTAQRIDAALREAQLAKDALRAYQVVYSALGAPSSAET